MEELLYEKLANDVAEWRQGGYACADYPLIGEILSFQRLVAEDHASLKFLREPQFHALEVYWYVRLKRATPHIIDLYQHYYGDDKRALFDALGVEVSRDVLRFVDANTILGQIKTDLDFVKEKKIQTLHEAAILPYPSYILALAMGAGKTVLIGTIIATEFAMSLRYPDGKCKFMKNAFVFAPGTTIIESLREISEMPFEQILPPDIHRDFLANLKIEYPNKGKNIQAQTGSSYNLIVTNTEKISLRVKPRKNQQQEILERAELQANSRLQTIASLPNLGIFSDEAHHTYGNTINKLKRVRETINYIHAQNPIITVVNTTGTPYHKKQTLKEVIVWYGLYEGIKDNILKNFGGGIHQYDIAEQSDADVFDDIVKEFFRAYGSVSLADGAKAKIAFYFNSQTHLNSSRLSIERAMTKVGENVAQILVNTQKSSSAEVDEFKRLNNPTNQKRVILLIGKGVEGWNCPSLFACALIKKQTTSNNYVLQAATRCLRQVPGNQHSAKIFLDYDNARILDKELLDNFRIHLDQLALNDTDKETVTLRILKTELPKLEITRTVKRAVRAAPPNGNITLEKPKSPQMPTILRSILTPDFGGVREILMPTGDTKKLQVGRKTTNCHTAAWKIASRYHVPVLPILNRLNALYPQSEMPDNHLYGLFQQVEQQQVNYKTVEEQVTELLALIRLQDKDGKDVFAKDEHGVYVHRLRMLKRTHQHMKAHKLLAKSEQYKDQHGLSFHYTPYNFDSEPERSLFAQVLSMLNTNPDDVAAFLFTGGLTDPNKTDFHFEYLGEDKRYHRYFPDFVLVKKSGEFYIIEVKAENERGDKTVEAKKKAVERLQKMQPDKFRYNIVYTSSTTISHTDMNPITNWIRGQNNETA